MSYIPAEMRPRIHAAITQDPTGTDEVLELCVTTLAAAIEFEQATANQVLADLAAVEGEFAAAGQANLAAVAADIRAEFSDEYSAV